MNDLLMFRINQMLDSQKSYRRFIMFIIVLCLLSVVCSVVLQLKIVLYGFVVLLAMIILMRPITGIYFCVLSDLWLSGLRIYGANPRTFIVVLIILAIFLRSAIHRTSEKRNLELYTLAPIVFLLIWVIIYNIALNNPISTYYRWAVTYAGLRIALPLLIVYLIDDSAKLKNFLYFVIFLISISALVGIFQFLIGGPFDVIRLYLGKSYILSGEILKRTTGLSRTFIVFSYELLSGFLLLFGTITTAGAIRKNRIIVWALLSIIGVALLSNFTRSAIGGVIAGSAVIIWLSKKLSIFKRITFIIILFISFYILGRSLPRTSTDIYKERFTIRDISAKGRIARFQLALAVAKVHPFGVGSAELYSEQALESWTVVKGMSGIDRQSLSAHNHFLNVLTYFGIPGLLFFLWFIWNFLKIQRNLLKISSNQFFKGIGIGGIGFFIAYFLHCIFHNAGPIQADHFFWYIAGIILSAYNLCITNSKSKNTA